MLKSCASDVQVSYGNTDIQEFSEPGLGDVQKSRNPEIQESRNPEVQKSRNPEIQKSRNICIPVFLCFWIPGFLYISKPRLTEFLYVCVSVAYLYVSSTAFLHLEAPSPGKNHLSFRTVFLYYLVTYFVVEGGFFY